MEEVFIPDTIEGVGKLLTASQWDRAAIVWAYVHCEQAPGGDRQSTIAKNSNASDKPYTPESFAALGFAGLRSKDTVRAHWKRWQEAVDSGHAMPVKPGDPIPGVALPWERAVKPKKKTEKPAAQSKSKSKTEPATAKPETPATPSKKLVDNTTIRDVVESMPGKSASDIVETLESRGIVNPNTGKTPSRDTVEDVMRVVEAVRSAAPVDYETIPGNKREQFDNAVKRERKKLDREYAEKLAAEIAEYKAQCDQNVAAYKAQLDEQAAKDIAVRNKERASYKLGLESIREQNGIISVSEYKLIKTCLHPDSRASASDERLATAFRLFSDPKIEIRIVKNEVAQREGGK